MTTTKRITQKDRILKYIRDFGSITDLEATKELGILQFGTRLYELKEKGYMFKTEWESSENRYGDKVEYKRYYLVDDAMSENMKHIPRLD